MKFTCQICLVSLQIDLYGVVSSGITITHLEESGVAVAIVNLRLTMVDELAKLGKIRNALDLLVDLPYVQVPEQFVVPDRQDILVVYEAMMRGKLVEDACSSQELARSSHVLDLLLSNRQYSMATLLT